MNCNVEYTEEFKQQVMREHEELGKSAKQIDYYNNERCQWNLNKMTPAQCRCHLLNAS